MRGSSPVALSGCQRAAASARSVSPTCCIPSTIPPNKPSVSVSALSVSATVAISNDSLSARANVVLPKPLGASMTQTFAERVAASNSRRTTRAPVPAPTAIAASLGREPYDCAARVSSVVWTPMGVATSKRLETSTPLRRS